MPSKIHTLLLFGPIIITCLSPPRTTAATAVHFHSVDHTLTHHPRRESPPRTTAFDQGDVERGPDYGSPFAPIADGAKLRVPGTVLLSPRWPCRFPRALAPSIRTTSRSIPVMSRLAASLIITALTESLSTTSWSRRDGGAIPSHMCSHRWQKSLKNESQFNYRGCRLCHIPAFAQSLDKPDQTP